MSEGNCRKCGIELNGSFSVVDKGVKVVIADKEEALVLREDTKLCNTCVLEVRKCSYRVTWSEEDGKYVGLCDELPRLSYLAATQEAALQGINDVINEISLESIPKGT